MHTQNKVVCSFVKHTKKMVLITVLHTGLRRQKGMPYLKLIYII